MPSPNSVQRAPDPHPTVAPHLVPERRGTVAFWSHSGRDGDWVLPRLFRAVAVMGNVELDLRRALVGPGTSFIEVVAIMGNVEIIVPPGLRVEFEVEGVMGYAGVARKAPSTMSPDAPLVRISGTAFWAAVEVKIVDPGAAE